MNFNTMMKQSKDMTNDQEAVKTVMDLNKDSAQLYEMAANATDNEKLRDKFERLRIIHQRSNALLQSILEWEGASADIAPQETLRGRAEKIMGTVEARFSGKPEKALISRLEQSESRCLDGINESLGSDDISTDVRQVLVEEKETVRKTHNYMATLREGLEAA